MNDARPILAESEVAARVQAFEQQNGVWTIRQGDIALWRLLRFEVVSQLQNMQLKRAPIDREALFGSLPRAAWQYAMAARGYRYIGKTSNSGLRDRREGKYHDVYFDDLIDAVPGGAKMSSLDAAGFDENSRNAYRQPVFDDTAVMVISAVMGRIFPTRVPSTSVRILSELLTSELDLPEFTPRRIQRKYDVFRYRAAAYRLVLKRLKIRAVLVANTGLLPLLHAARSLNIPFVELQHGEFGPHHPECLAANTLDAGADSLMLPDFLAVFGQFDADRLADTALGKLGLTRPIGAPAVASARALRQAKFRPRSDLPVIVFTSQGFGQAHVHAFISAFLSAYTEPMRLILRLHPGYDADVDAYRNLALADPRVEVMPGYSMPPTHEVIALSDLHLSVSSTCHYDALGIGTPTAILALPGYLQMDDLIRNGAAPLVETPGQLAQLVQHRSWPVIDPVVCDYFFRPDYAGNMLELFGEWENTVSDQARP
jgi:hypothetical protein